MNQRTINLILEAWADHQDQKPDAPEDYLVNIDHLRIRMDEWERGDNAWRLLIGVNMANNALRAVIGERDQWAKDEAHRDKTQARAGQTPEENHE